MLKEVCDKALKSMAPSYRMSTRFMEAVEKRLDRSKIYNL